MASARAIEDVQTYWNARPCNLRHSAKEVGTREYFDEVRARKYFVESHIPTFADFLTWRGKKVLEIGCGLGTETVNFALHGAQVTAVDVSEKSLELARKRAEVYGVEDQIKFYQGNAEELTQVVPVERYDLIWAFGSIHHSPHPERIIRQICAYMDDKSELRMMVYHKWSWKVLWIILRYGHGAFWKTDALVAKYSEAQTGCPITYTYTKRSVQHLLQGLKIQESFVEHIFPYEIPAYKKYQYRRVWYFRWMPRRWFNRLEQILGWHLCVRSTL